MGLSPTDPFRHACAVPLMPVKLSRTSFVALLEKSGLIPGEALAALVEEFQQHDQGGAEEGERLAQFLVRKGELTTWQARKLLQGKHKGFTLGKYKLLSLLGRGGMSSVYLAEHLVMRRRCAIKVLPSKQVHDQAALTRFHQEAQAVAALDDPNIVRAYDVDSVSEGANEVHFLVMEYVEGRSLQEVVDQDGPLPIPEAIDYVCQAARGLDHAHRAGMVHRDIKPSNLLLDLTGTVKVLDMGLARFFEQTDQQSLTLQHDQRVLGTADYLSPEQAVDSHRVDTRSDIYSLGGTLYFLLTGHPPFPEGTLAQRLLAHQTKKPRPVNEIRKDVPASLARLLASMMEKSPDNRPASAGEARRRLEEWLNQHGASFASTEPPLQESKRRARKPADPTEDGWNDLPVESFTPPPVNRNGDAGSGGPDDPHLGEFLTSLSSDVAPSGPESDRITGAKTVVSGTRRQRVATSKEQGSSVRGDSAVARDSRVRGGSGVRQKASSSAALSGSRARRASQPSRSTLVVGLSVSAALVLLMLGGYAFWPDSEPKPSSDNGEKSSVATVEGSVSEEAPAADTRPRVEPGSDITVGPEGNFASIQEAIDYVRQNFQPLSKTDQRTIRVVGGHVYPEAIAIDNSQFGSFPQGVQIICKDESPAILAPPGLDPIVDLINVERFRLEGFELRGGQRAIGMRVQGYLLNTTFENLSIRDITSSAIQGIGIAGIRGRRVEFRSIVVHQSAPHAAGLSLESGDRPTKELLIHRCRFGGQLSTGVHISGEVANVEIKECRFSEIATPVLFAGGPPQIENVSLVNNTFHEFDLAAVRFSEVPQIGSRGVGFQKNLFVSGAGPEVSVDGDAGSQSLSKGMVNQLNWTQGADQNGVDIFSRNGRRDVGKVEFVSQDVTLDGGFLKPKDPELRTAASAAANPRFIGAVPPIRHETE